LAVIALSPSADCDAGRAAEVPAWARPAALTAVANALAALPAHAEVEFLSSSTPGISAAAPAHGPFQDHAEHGASATWRHVRRKQSTCTLLLAHCLSIPAQAGKIFDFNLTLPLMAGQFLLLMVFLDKTWFGPVGKLLEDRDAELRSKLGAFRDNRCVIALLKQRSLGRRVSTKMH